MSRLRARSARRRAARPARPRSVVPGPGFVAERAPVAERINLNSPDGLLEEGFRSHPGETRCGQFSGATARKPTSSERRTTGRISAGEAKPSPHVDTISRDISVPIRLLAILRGGRNEFSHSLGQNRPLKTAAQVSRKQSFTSPQERGVTGLRQVMDGAPPAYPLRGLPAAQRFCFLLQATR